MLRLDLAQRHRRSIGEPLQALEGFEINRECACRQAPLHLQMNQMTAQVVVQLDALDRRHAHPAGSSLVKPALAISPMRIRNSVPMSAA